MIITQIENAIAAKSVLLPVTADTEWNTDTERERENDGVACHDAYTLIEFIFISCERTTNISIWLKTTNRVATAITKCEHKELNEINARESYGMLMKNLKQFHLAFYE